MINGRGATIRAGSALCLLLLFWNQLYGGSVRVRVEELEYHSSVVELKVSAPQLGKAKGSCTFEHGAGMFEGDLARGNWTWKPDKCEDLYVDFITALTRESSTRITPSSNFAPHARKLPPKRTEPIKLISIGDSLDRHQVQFLCDNLQMNYLPQLYDVPGKARRSFVFRQDSVRVCTNQNIHTDQSYPFLAFAHLPIFGMKQRCEQDGKSAAKEVDSSRYHRDSSAERIRALLHAEILDRLPKEGAVVFLVHSSGIGDGCNLSSRISSQMARDYQREIWNIQSMLRKLVPEALIYWRAGPPRKSVSEEKEDESVLALRRQNQKVLNDIIRESVASGSIIDWWSQMEHVTAEEEKLWTDQTMRRKRTENKYEDWYMYSKPSSMAAYNLFLNTLYDQKPELWIGELGSDWSAFNKLLLETP